MVWHITWQYTARSDTITSFILLVMHFIKIFLSWHIQKSLIFFLFIIMWVSLRRPLINNIAVKVLLSDETCTINVSFHTKRSKKKCSIQAGNELCGKLYYQRKELSHYQLLCTPHNTSQRRQVTLTTTRNYSVRHSVNTYYQPNVFVIYSEENRLPSQLFSSGISQLKLALSRYTSRMPTLVA